MKVFILYIIFASWGSIVYSQEVKSELELCKAKHQNAIEALDKQKNEAIAKTAQSYISLLVSVEKEATEKGELDLVAAAIKEQGVAIKGTLEPETPASLSRFKLQMIRQTLLKNLERLNIDFLKRRKQLDADYLRVLSAMQARVVRGSELAKKIDLEKEVLLTGAIENVGLAAVKGIVGKNAVKNGNFEVVVGSKIKGWENAHYVSVQKEGQNTFVRFSGVVEIQNGCVAYREVFQEIDLPKNVKTISISGKIRARNCALDLPLVRPAVGVVFSDQQGTKNKVAAFLDKKSGEWEEVKYKGPVPSNAVKANVMITDGRLAGLIDFDDVEVTFK